MAFDRQRQREDGEEMEQLVVVVVMVVIGVDDIDKGDRQERWRCSGWQGRWKIGRRDGGVA
jgi:hypothetical protein